MMVDDHCYGDKTFLKKMCKAQLLASCYSPFKVKVNVEYDPDTKGFKVSDEEDSDDD
jgi:hypothetical protein